MSSTSNVSIRHSVNDIGYLTTSSTIKNTGTIPIHSIAF